MRLWKSCLIFRIVLSAVLLAKSREEIPATGWSTPCSQRERVTEYNVRGNAVATAPKRAEKPTQAPLLGRPSLVQSRVSWRKDRRWLDGVGDETKIREIFQDEDQDFPLEFFLGPTTSPVKHKKLIFEVGYTTSPSTAIMGDEERKETTKAREEEEEDDDDALEIFYQALKSDVFLDYLRSLVRQFRNKKKSHSPQFNFKAGQESVNQEGVNLYRRGKAIKAMATKRLRNLQALLKLLYELENRCEREKKCDAQEHLDRSTVLEEETTSLTNFSGDHSEGDPENDDDLSLDGSLNSKTRIILHKLNRVIDLLNRTRSSGNREVKKSSDDELSKKNVPRKTTTAYPTTTSSTSIYNFVNQVKTTTTTGNPCGDKPFVIAWMKYSQNHTFPVRTTTPFHFFVSKEGRHCSSDEPPPSAESSPASITELSKKTHSWTHREAVSESLQADDDDDAVPYDYDEDQDAKKMLYSDTLSFSKERRNPVDYRLDALEYYSPMGEEGGGKASGASRKLYLGAPCAYLVYSLILRILQGLSLK